MRVLYVSKASRVAAHRHKVAVLACRAEVTLIVPELWGRAPLEEDAEAAYRVARLSAVLHGHNHFHLYRGLGRVLQPDRFDVVHVDEEPYSLVTLQVVRRARRLRVPALFFAWQNIDKSLPPPFGAVRRAVFRDATGGLAGTEEAAAVLRRRGFRGPLAVIPQMGVDTDRFRPDLAARQEVRRRIGIEEDAFLVGYAGRLVAEKGVDLLLESLAGVPSARAVLIGDGPQRADLVRLAAAADLEDRVRFTGDLPSLEMPRWLAALDCLVLPSRTTGRWKEQFGRVLVEAMACGVPVVGSDSGEIPRVIRDAGRVFPEGDGAALTRQLGELAAAPALRRSLAARGRERVLALYTQKAVVESTVEFYRVIAAPPGRRAAPERVRNAG